jgi:hypothetical protein
MCNWVRRPVVTAAGVFCAAVLAGCGYGVKEHRLPETGATLEGTIKYGNEPVAYAVVRVATESASAEGNVGEDGRYKVENVPVGAVKIGVNTDAAKGDYTSATMSRSYKGPEFKGKTGPVQLPKFVSVPARYADPETSGITTTTRSGTNTFDIVIPK